MLFLFLFHLLLITRSVSTAKQLDPGPAFIIKLLQKISPASWNQRIASFGETVPLRRLGRYNVHPKFTVSGISGGGSFTIVASYTMSDIMKGAGGFSSGTHTVAPAAFNDLRNLFDYRAMKEWTDKMAREGLIPDLNNFKQWTGAYIHHGITDPVPYSWDKINVDMYKLYGVPKVKSVVLQGWQTHCWPSMGFLVYKERCDFLSRFICGCGYCGVCDMFSVVLENYRPANLTRKPTGTNYRFFQNEFVHIGDTTAVSMADYGWAYVPKRCEPETGITCELHFYFHGCIESVIGLNAGWIPHWLVILGYLENADANDIIVVSPQNRMHWQNLTLFGCWDHWGYSNYIGGIRHAAQFGPQPLAIRKMYERIHLGK